MTPDKFIEYWKIKNIPPIKRDENWSKLKWHICKAGEPVNPISYASGGEIQIERFGIIGWLYKVKNADTGEYFYQCPLIESRESGTGKFGDWLVSVNNFCRKRKMKFALANITNQRLYKYLEKYDIPVAVDYRLYKVQIKEKI
jgi:hypothetical protein